jgi:hypothetical protein
MTLSYSRALWLEFFLDQTLESLIVAHVHAFEYWTGVARNVLYDNMKSVVLERRGDLIQFHPRMLELCGHYHFAVLSPKRLSKLVIISSTYKTDGWLPIVNTGFKDFKPEFFDNTPIKAAYDAVAPDKTKWTKFLKQMFDFAKVPFNCGDSNISKITAPVLIISGDK